MDISLKNAIAIETCQWNVRIEDNIGIRFLNISSSYKDSTYLKNNVHADPANIMESGCYGLTLSTLKIGADPTMAEVFPNRSTNYGNWRAFAGPEAGYETVGAANTSRNGSRRPPDLRSGPGGAIRPA